MAPETLVYLPLNHLMRLIAREGCTEFSSRESLVYVCGSLKVT